MYIELPLSLMLVINIVVWLFFHMLISLLCMKIPDEWFITNKHLFKQLSWEKDGQIWDDIFSIRKWKSKLPDASLFMKKAYNKKSMRDTSLETFNKFIIETRRAEFTHWVSILPAPVFFIWNPVWARLIIIIYALVANIPFILAQRYNRPRLERVYRMKYRQQRKDAHSSEVML